jgi:hypothetical protein
VFARLGGELLRRLAAGDNPRSVSALVGSVANKAVTESDEARAAGLTPTRLRAVARRIAESRFHGSDGGGNSAPANLVIGSTLVTWPGRVQPLVKQVTLESRRYLAIACSTRVAYEGAFTEAQRTSRSRPFGHYKKALKAARAHFRALAIAPHLLQSERPLFAGDAEALSVVLERGLGKRAEARRVAEAAVDILQNPINSSRRALPRSSSSP